MTSRSWRNYYADEIDINDNASEMVNHLNIKQKQQEKHYRDLEMKEMQIDQQYQISNVEVIISPKYVSNFLRFLDLPLINCKI